MKELITEELRSIQCEVLKAVDVFCRAHQIRYFIAYGTLIGAVRHKGYIPWDDDIDIVMLRPDYERFLKEFNRDAEQRYRVLHVSNDSAYPYEFAKVEDRKTILVENTDIAYNIGVNIDVFVLDRVFADDNITLDRWKQIGKLEKIMYVKRILPNSKHKRRFVKAVGVSLAKAYCGRYNIEHLLKHINEIAKKFCNESGTGKLANICQPYFGTKEILEEEWFADQIELEFEGYRFFAPVDYDVALTRWYGNYMQLPPEDKRVTHHDFAAYWRE